MRILFSAIGSTDPISNERDGGMLHICRVYQPDKVYLYLSKEMCEYHDMDDRYRKVLELLELDGYKNIETIVIRDEDMSNVQIFDAFILKFEEIITNIKNNDNPSEILLNVSSGTPAMKSSLQLIATLWNGCTAIQVSTPRKLSNKYHEDKDNYDLELQWLCNKDREEGFENRCSISGSKDLLDRLKKENIKKFINEYNYESAKILMESLDKKPSERFKECLNIAIAREKLDIRSINLKRKKLGVDHWFPIREDRKMKEYEYLMVMQVKLYQKRYADYVRDITPIFFSFAEDILEKYVGIKFSDIAVYKEGQGWYIVFEKMKKKNIFIMDYWKDNSHIYTHLMIDILKQKGCPANIVKILDEVREVERKVRNLAAHDIVGVSDEWIEKSCGFNSDRIMNNMYKLAKFAGIVLEEDNKNAYLIMNDDLIAML